MKTIRLKKEINIGWKLTGVIESFEVVEVVTPKGIKSNRLLLNVSRSNGDGIQLIYRVEREIEKYEKKVLVFVIAELENDDISEVAYIHHPS